MITLTDDTFTDHITPTSGPAIVMFSAPWAGPCNLVRPVFEETATRYGNQINFFEFVLDDNPVIPERFGVKTIPLFVMFEDDKPISLSAGALPRKDIFSMCHNLLDETVS